MHFENAVLNYCRILPVYAGRWLYFITFILLFYSGASVSSDFIGAIQIVLLLLLLLLLSQVAVTQCEQPKNARRLNRGFVVPLNFSVSVRQGMFLCYFWFLGACFVTFSVPV